MAIQLTSVYSKTQENYSSGASTVNISDGGRYLCINIYVHNGAHQDNNAEANITATKNADVEDSITQQYDGQKRTIYCKVAIFTLASGDTITFTNKMGSYRYLTVQTHTVIKMSGSALGEFVRLTFQGKCDGVIPASTIYELPAGYRCLAIGFVNNAENPNQDQSVSITSSDTVEGHVRIADTPETAMVAVSSIKVEGGHGVTIGGSVQNRNVEAITINNGILGPSRVSKGTIGTALGNRLFWPANNATFKYVSRTAYVTRGYIVYRVGGG